MAAISTRSAAHCWTEAEAKTALINAGLLTGQQRLEIQVRDNRLAVFLPEDRLAWFPTNAEGREQLAKERRILRLVGRHCGFAAPRIEYEDQDAWDVRSLVLGSVDDSVLRQRIECNAPFAFQTGQALGRILADLHTSIPSAELKDWLPAARPWPRPGDLLHVSRVVEDQDLLARIDAALAGWSTCEREHQPAVLVHGDFGYHNLVMDPDDLRVKGVFDFEGAFFGDYHQDFAYMLLQRREEPVLEGAISTYEPATGRRIDRVRVSRLNAVAAIGFLAHRHGHAPEEAWCGRTLAQDLEWTRGALTLAGM